MDETGARQKASLYEETLDVLQGIRFAPAAIVAKVSGSETLKDVYEHGSRERLAYEKAGQDYEAMMTQPRRDMGDSIQKAFRNVDSILEDLGMEISEENRRAVRILGYNRMELSRENVETVRATDMELQRVVDKMTPAAVLQTIRDGKNPLEMTLPELDAYLDSIPYGKEQEIEKFSRFYINWIKIKRSRKRNGRPISAFTVCCGSLRRRITQGSGR